MSRWSPVDNTRAVIIVGVGGIGSALFQDLCRFLPHTIDIHLMDGDTVEGKNIQRQHFSRRDLGRNKAEALAEKASVAIGLDRIYYHPTYLTSVDQLAQIARNNYKTGVLVGCVDNHPARRVMEEFVSRSGGPLYYLDCANEETRGEVVAVFVDKAQRHGRFRSELDPSVLTDNTGDPTTASCTQQLDAGNIQTLFTNRKAAILALELIGAHLKGDTRVGITYFRECQTPRLREVADADGPAKVAAAQ